MTETIKTCIQCDNTYSSDMFSVRVRICDFCRENNKIKRIERQKQWKLNNPEKLKAYAQTYKNANADSIKEKKNQYSQDYRQHTLHCELCGYDIKKYKKSQHEKTKNHQYFLQKSLNNEELERPDRKTIEDGMEYFYCSKCKKRELNYNWYLHLCSEEHKNKA